jgi:FkbM family methyltransferase
MTPRTAAGLPIRRHRVWIARALASALRRLPNDVQSIVKWDLRPVGRLDYRPSPILMAVNSPWQAYRLWSCAKEPETVAWLERVLRPSDTFYDIGANVGAYSLVAFAITQGIATIVAFEPGFGTFAELCRNIELNRAEGSVIPVPIALGDRTTIANLWYSETTPGAARHSWDATTPGEALVPELVLPTVSYRLDDLVTALSLPQPTLIKLDVDGPEFEVLEGADRVLSDRSLRSCLVELDASTASYEKAIARLATKGFEIESRHVRGGGDGPVQNLIFARA